MLYLDNSGNFQMQFISKGARSLEGRHGLHVSYTPESQTQRERNIIVVIVAQQLITE